MRVQVRPDESRSAGGYAILSFAGGNVSESEVMVAIMEVANGKWLAPSSLDDSGRIAIGDANWQAARHDFGPYEVLRPEGRVEVVVGPEIVNKIDGYTNVQILAGELSGTVAWSVDIVPLEGAAASSGLRVIRKKVEVAAPSAAMVETVEFADAEVPVDHEAGTDQAGDAGGGGERRRLVWPLAVGVGVLLLASLAAAWFFLQLQEPVPEAPAPVAELPEPAPEPEAPAEAPMVADTCNLAALRAVDGGLSAQLAAVETCGNEVSADTLLAVVEDAAAQEDAAALLLFGTLYDKSETDPLAEEVIGLTFGDDPAQAAEYYARAAAAGNADAGARLARVCAVLADATETLSQGARDDFCP